MQVNDNARAAFQALRSGGSNGYQADDLGAYWPYYDTLSTILHDQGHTAMMQAFNAMLKDPKYRSIQRLLVSSQEQSKIEHSHYPKLPDEIQEQIHAPVLCATWLTDYITFASQAAPMTPRTFHEANGLFAASIAIARRLVYRTGTGGVYPNLFMLEISPPALHKKTTGLNVLSTLLELCGMEHLLLAQSVTPQSLSMEMSAYIPSDLETYADARRDEWLLERSYAAQRGWLIDEAAGLFDSFDRDYNAGLQLMILRLYDCAASLREQTASRGRVVVKNSYLNILGATTPDTIRKHINNRALWGSGLWSRFAMITPDSKPVYSPQPEPMKIPSRLISGLRRLFDLFPAPQAVLEEEPMGDKGKTRPVLELYNQHEPSEVIFRPDAKELLNAYSKTVGFDMLQQGVIDSMLFSSYDRLGIQAIKVSLLLAAIDSDQLPVIISKEHVIRAIQIIEQWRSSLHSLWDNGTESDEVMLSNRILDYLKNKGAKDARWLCQQLHRTSNEVHTALDLLQEAGQVDFVMSGRRKDWYVVESVATVAKCSNTSATLSEASQSLKAQSVAV